MKVCPKCGCNDISRFIYPCGVHIQYHIGTLGYPTKPYKKGLELYFDEETRQPDTLICQGCGWHYETDLIELVGEEMEDEYKSMPLLQEDQQHI